MLRDFLKTYAQFEFLEPGWLWLLLILPLWLWWSVALEGTKKGNFIVSHLKQIPESGTKRIRRTKIWIRISYLLAAALLTISMAKPVFWNRIDPSIQYKQGIDIIITMDASLSMLARDFEPNRLEVSKQVAEDFVSGRNGDRIGLVVYEGEAYTACPLTADYAILKKQIANIQPGTMEGGTAIGTGLGTAVARLRDPKLPSKVIILLTDGVNTEGELTPEQATELAIAKNIRVYTIGVGTLGMAPSPIFTPFGIRYQNMPVEIDEKTLMTIAQKTGGTYFRATDEASLRKIYREIDRLEKRKIKFKPQSEEIPTHPTPFLVAAILLILLPWLYQTFSWKTHE